MNTKINFPPQQLPMSKKTKAWRKKCVDWGDSKSYLNYEPVRNSVKHKKILFDLLDGIIHMDDLEDVLNPTHTVTKKTPKKIKHYPIINSKLDVLRGEESRRIFDHKVIVTNPTAISKIEENKKNELFAKLQQAVSKDLSEEEFNKQIEEINYYINYTWQDLRELKGNCTINHYIKEYNIKKLFTDGFMNAMSCGEEIYMCDIVGGEPTIELVNPNKIRVFKSGYSNKIEDADMIIYEDYWSPGRIIDTYYESLTPADMKYIENMPTIGSSNTDSMDNVDPRGAFVGEEGIFVKDIDTERIFLSNETDTSLQPYDADGNIRVLKVYWKSRRKIKKVKSYNKETGKVEYNLYPETYIIDKNAGEEEKVYYINEAWEGTKIGDKIYVNMGPRPVQYNRLSNPSRCHFGIVGSIYNLNEGKPFSLVDKMKPYSYLYDVIHDRLNKTLATHWGSIMHLDLSQIPKNWDVNKWMFFAKNNHLAVTDSFKEGNVGQATGKLAGSFGNNSKGILTSSDGNYIQQLINVMEYIKQEMSEVAGIPKQREGQISNRETVGGVERANIQSSHITEWLYVIHEDVKKRALECFLETSKIAMKGNSKKFQYILPDSTTKIMEIDGDEFAEADYGLVVDNSNSTQTLNSQLDTLAQAALQNQTLSFSTIMKMYSSCSIAEKQRMIEKDEQNIKQQRQQEQQQQLQAQQQIQQMQNEAKMQELQATKENNILDNQTRIQVATIQAQNKENIEVFKTDDDKYSQEEKDVLAENKRQFDAKMELDKKKFESDKKLREKELSIKRNKTTK